MTKNGKVAEAFTIGQCTVEHYGYLRWSDAMNFARQHQPPKMRTGAMKLLYAVRGECGELASAVKFYTAIGTPFDFKHGVDCWIELGGKVEVTIDFTVNPHKSVQGAKADVIVTADDISSETRLARVAAEIRLIMMQKLKQRCSHCGQ